MLWNRFRAAAAGSSVCAVSLLVALGLPGTPLPGLLSTTSPAPPQTQSPAAASSSSGSTLAPVAQRASIRRSATTFYVAPYGRDRNRGTSPAHPWRTVARVNRARLKAGDRVLFRGGSTFADDTLMPGQGFRASGAAGRPIVFGSYGNGMARLTKGVWLGRNASYPDGPSHLTFERLILGPSKGFQGTGDYIRLIGLNISHLVGPHATQETGIASEGSHWTIEDNKISYTGDSGMLLGFSAGSPGDPPGGQDYVIIGNTVAHTGLDGGLSYPMHAIYLKVADARVSNNRLAYFRDDGISLRYRNALVSDNYIAHGGIGIAWYQYDQHPGMTQLIRNTIAFVSSAAIFVCGVAESCSQPIESFVVKGNKLLHTTTKAPLNLQPTSGTYLIQANTGL